MQDNLQFDLMETNPRKITDIDAEMKMIRNIRKNRLQNEKKLVI